MLHSYKNHFKIAIDNVASIHFDMYNRANLQISIYPNMNVNLASNFTYPFLSWFSIITGWSLELRHGFPLGFSGQKSRFEEN